MFEVNYYNYTYQNIKQIIFMYKCPYVRQSFGYNVQLVRHLNLSQCIHPIGGVRAKPLFRLSTAPIKMHIQVNRNSLLDINANASFCFLISENIFKNLYRKKNTVRGVTTGYDTLNC